MEKKYGIEGIKGILDLGLTLGKAVKEAKENDGKIDLNDLPLIISVFPKIAPAFENIKNLPKEVKDLDTEELKELQDFLSKRLGEVIGKEKVIEQINLSINVVTSIYALIESFK